MLTWLTANAGTLIVLALVLVLAAMAVRRLIKDRKQGKSSCGCGCSGCAGCGGCHSAEQARNENK